jgi:predicted transcriptional regulator
MSGESSSGQMLWNAETRAFDGPRLRRAIVARGWTVAEFAGAARVRTASLYNALSGRPVRDGTAIRIFEALEKRNPMGIALEVA